MKPVKCIDCHYLYQFSRRGIVTDPPRYPTTNPLPLTEEQRQQILEMEIVSSIYLGCNKREPDFRWEDIPKKVIERRSYRKYEPGLTLDQMLQREAQMDVRPPLFKDPRFLVPTIISLILIGLTIWGFVQ